ncbi:hypothetical protein [Shouchella clausii]|uniref:hypothetical protein n=1 Tax=Shouchella clausii TaxID=79880 RepID=UPI001C736FEA|nr:hypothetical protein [Shouchella clausii]MBX0320230.1 hypothetical protein [Shouchella clausii]
MLLKTKVILSVIVGVLILVINSIFGSLFAADLSIEAQLSNSDSAQAGYNFFKLMREYALLIYLGCVAILFSPEIKYLLLKSK